MHCPSGVPPQVLNKKNPLKDKEQKKKKNAAFQKIWWGQTSMSYVTHNNEKLLCCHSKEITSIQTWSHWTCACCIYSCIRESL